MAAEVSTSGIREVLSRETPEGIDFFRAIDTVKKRAQRERTFQPLDSIDVADTSSAATSPHAEWLQALHETIDDTLSPREVALIHATLEGETPAEIAQKWGVAPKTISNEKSRVIQKLRDALSVDQLN
jgi:DNA-directed RNA polymerase specialized sigma24 family protein